MVEKGEVLQFIEKTKQDVGEEELEETQEEKDQRSLITKVRDLLLNQNMELSYSQDYRPFARIRKKGRYEVYPLDSMQFHDYVYELYDESTQSVLTKNTYEAVVESLGSRARIRGSSEVIALRTARVGNATYLNLCNDEWEVVEIDRDGWRIIKDSPVWFYRTNDMDELPLPIETTTRDIEKLKKYVNFDKGYDFDLMVAFLLSCFLYQTSRPILILQGTAGVGKSFTSEILRTVVDPAKQKKSISRARPTVDSLAIDVLRQSLLVYDNFSTGAVTAEVSDMFCTISTNQAYSKRALYTDSDEVLVRLGRSVIINGIDDIAKRQDLLDRSIVLELPLLKTRQSELTLRESFKKDHPSILGHLLNCVSDSLAHTGESDYKESRMTDFGQLVENAHRGLGWDKHYFKSIYKDNRDIACRNTIESNPFIQGILELMEGYQNRCFSKTDLINEIKRLASYDYHDTKRGVIPSARKVSERLKRDMPLLRAAGITFEERLLDGLRIVEFKLI